MVGALVAVPLLGVVKAVYLELRSGDLEKGGPIDETGEPHPPKDEG
ncbi:MAG: hypothetical protein V7636_69, partial [Actinomycetota bacterium]